MSEQNKDTDQVLLSVAVFSLAAVTIFLIGFMLPAILMGLVLAEAFLYQSYSGGIYKLDQRFLKIFVISLGFYFLLFSFPKESVVLKFKGFFFIYGDDYISLGLSNLLQFMGRVLPTRLAPKSFSGLGLRTYLWSIWLLAAAIFAIKVKCATPPVLSIKRQSKDKSKDVIHLGHFKDKVFNTAFKVSDACLRHHMQVLGASGYGKSVFLFHIIGDRIRKNRGLLFVDLKADIDNVKKVTGFAKDAGRLEKLKFFSCANPEFSSYYNILGRGNATELKDRIMSSLNWSEVFYKDQSSAVLLKVMIALVWIRDHTEYKPHLGTLVNCLTATDSLADIKKLVPATESQIISCIEQVDYYLRDKDKYDNLQGLRTQLEELLLSEFGHKLRPTAQDLQSGKCIDIYNAVKNLEIVYFLLDSRRYSESAKSLGRMILADLKAASAEIDGTVSPDKRQAFNIIIDEFADMASDEFISFLDRARSSGMGTIVAHQEISDLKRISPETADRLMHLTSTTVAFLSKLPDSAEKISSIAGTKTSFKITEKAQSFLGINLKSGDISLREVEEFILHPNQIKKLEIGEAVVIGKYPTAYSGIVKMSPPEKSDFSDDEFKRILNSMSLKLNEKTVSTQTDSKAPLRVEMKKEVSW